MKLLKNELIILVGLFALIAAVSAGVLFYPKNNPSDQYTPVINITIPTEEKNVITTSTTERIKKELSAERTLDEDLYSIIIPEDWVRAVIQSDKFLALVIKPEGEIDPANLADVDYDTYYAVNNTTTEVASLDEYVDLLKRNLASQITSIEFIKQSYGTINGHEAIYLESKSSIEGKNYGTLLTFVADGNWVWAISFNTLEDSWDENKNTFYKISNSLVIK